MCRNHSTHSQREKFPTKMKSEKENEKENRKEIMMAKKNDIEMRTKNSKKKIFFFEILERSESCRHVLPTMNINYTKFSTFTDGSRNQRCFATFNQDRATRTHSFRLIFFCTWRKMLSMFTDVQNLKLAIHHVCRFRLSHHAKNLEFTCHNRLTRDGKKNVANSFRSADEYDILH